MKTISRALVAAAAVAAAIPALAQAQGRILYEERVYTAPPPGAYVSPASCADRNESLRERRWRFDEAMTRTERERADIDRVAAELADELRHLDSRDRAAVDAYNARSDAHNRRVEAHNRDIERLNDGAARLNGEAATFASDCSGVRPYVWRNVEMLPAYRIR